MQQFVDEVTVTVHSGSGGPGAVSFRREKYVPRGGPDGGDGGRGGNVVFRTKPNLKTLRHLRFKSTYRAENGRPGEGAKRHGRDGADAVIDVPPGTLIRSTESGNVLVDLSGETSEWVCLSGGRGGKGNTHFKSSRQQAPRFAQPGEEGSSATLRVELALIADAGFVGLPNAGKSSLLGALTAAEPKVAGYPFTTTIPSLGVIKLFDRDVVLADIPGIIEGAADGAGLGLRFLKHIARTRALVFVLDLSEEAGDPEYSYHTLCEELGRYEPALLGKRRLIVGTKLDLDGTHERLSEIRHAAWTEGANVVGVSSFSREGLDELVERLAELTVVEGEREDRDTWRII
ncbi:MAG: GTPase ObgE [Spirochaetes bacterium]|nr:GTPase ObgE [Spirochaetota bacterium]